MAETTNLEEIIRQSLKAWRNNLILGMPFFLNTIVSLLFIVAYAAFVYFLANPLSGIETGEPLTMFRSINWGLVILDLCLACVVFVLILVTSAFFLSGAIGMSKEALTKGKTSLGDLFRYGERHFFKVLLANIAILVITLIVVFTTLILQLMLNGEYSNIVIITLGILFAPVPYAIVLSGCGVREGVKRGTDAAWSNKLDAVLIYVFATTLTSFIMGIAFAVMGLIASLVIALLPIQELTKDNIPEIIYSSMPFIITGLIASVLVYVAALVLVSEPIVTLCWANYYLKRGKNE